MKFSGTKTLSAAAVVVTLCSGISDQAQAAAIGLNFNGNDNVNLAAGDLAGAPGYAQLNWNNFDKYGGDFPNTTTGGTSVKDETGVTVPNVRADFDATGEFNSGSSTATPNGRLMNGYQDSNGNPNSGTSLNSDQNRPYVGIFNLGTDYTSGGYSVIVYTDGDTTGRGGAFWIETANYSDGRNQTGTAITPTYYAQDPGNFNDTGFVQVTSIISGSPTQGNYIVFTGLTSANIVVRADEIYDVGGFKRTPINGIQIVAIPEPASMAIAVAAGFGLLGRRRRLI